MIEAFVNSKVKSRIFRFLVSNRGRDFILSEIAAYCGISKSRASEVLSEFREREVVQTRNVGRSVLYSLSVTSEDVRTVEEFLGKGDSGKEKALKEFVSLCRQRFGRNLLSVVLYGSSARGTFRETSDIDLLVIIKAASGDGEKVLEEMEIEMLRKHKVAVQSVLTSAEAIEWHAAGPNPLFYGILLGYRVLYNPEYFEGLMEVVRESVRVKRPVYIEGGREWKLAHMI